MIAEGKGGGAGTTKREGSWQGEGSRGELKGEVRMRLKSESGEREGGRGYRGRRKRGEKEGKKKGRPYYLQPCTQTTAALLQCVRLDAGKQSCLLLPFTAWNLYFVLHSSLCSNLSTCFLLRFCLR